MWEVITRETFDRWFGEQPEGVREELLATISILREDGPNLCRPQVDTLNGSDFSNMKELRVQVSGHPIRACFAFDPLRRAIILCAGDKKGQDGKRFYKRLVKIADAEYREHLATMEDE